MIFEAHWVLAVGKNFCQECSREVASAWCFYATPTTWTRCLCTGCVDRVLANG